MRMFKSKLYTVYSVLQILMLLFSHKSGHAARKSAVDFAVIAKALKNKFVR